MKPALCRFLLCLLPFTWLQAAAAPLSATDAAPAARAPTHPLAVRQPDGNGGVKITGDLKQWHKVTLDLAGPAAKETDNTPNPFTDYRFDVTFRHESGQPTYTVPGYFAADGRAANTSATAGTVWRAHLSPDKTGKWTYTVSFRHGKNVAIGEAGEKLAPFDGRTGSFTVTATDKTGRDFRGKGRLTYVGGRYLRFAGNGEYFLKAGADAPETLLAFADFDGTEPGRKREERSGEASPTQLLKHYQVHLQDWQAGDPTWQGDKGKGLIGAINYLARKGVTAFSFLTYNAGGDGDNVWPFVSRTDKFHYDCSKLDQWQIVFDHAQQIGLYLHFKTQETENDDNTILKNKVGVVPESLDGGDLGNERKLYYRELVARFGHELALNWNFGEENTQTPEQQRAEIAYVAEIDPYQHHRVIHSYPDWQDRVYTPLLGKFSRLTGASLQNSWKDVHQLTLHWIRESAKAGTPWVVANDEQGSAGTGVPPDPGYEGYANRQRDGKAVDHDLHDIRKATLWGNLMAGGAGVEYYFGYQLPENDLVCEDWRSRDQSWDYARIALEFFSEHQIPINRMANADELVGNPAHDNSRYCFAEPGKLYLVYLPNGGQASLDLAGAKGVFTLSWFNPRTGGALQAGGSIKAGAAVSLAAPDTNDWLAVIRR
jgi:hypothetical protein